MLVKNWANPGVLWKKAPRAIRAMRGKALQTVPFKGISTVLWVHQKLPQSTVSQAFPSKKSYESKAGYNRTPATVLWVPLKNLSMGLSEKGCFPIDFQETKRPKEGVQGNGPLRHSGKRPIKVGKRPINLEEGKHPLNRRNPKGDGRKGTVDRKCHKLS